MLRVCPLVLVLLLLGCSSIDEPFSDPVRRRNQLSEYIDRRANEYLFTPSPAKLQPAPSYPWDQSSPTALKKITKEFFRCQGSEFNPVRTVTKGDGSIQYLHDCGGTDRHSLPVRDEQEFIYPVLIELLNAVQAKTGKQVVITSGHRCPAHNTYVDDSRENSTSKHTIGAAVTFYVKGMENQTGTVVQHLLDHYVKTTKYQGLKEYQSFKRDEGSKQTTRVSAWLNKEIVIRVYDKDEGRNFDNRHPYPYIAITVRHDLERDSPVSYSWDKAQQSFMRW